MWKIKAGAAFMLTLLLPVPRIVQAQSSDTILLNRQQAEKIFLERNISLLAGKLNIRQAEAQVLQARLWPNPNVSVDEVNLWATPAQLSMGSGLPPVFSNGAGRNQQVAAQLEQVIITAGKRKKLIAIEEVSRDMAASYFEDLVRNLKVEFRKLLTELQYVQLYQAVFAREITETQLLLTAYERQAESGNVNRADIARLKALLLGLNDENNELCKQVNGIQKELGVLMSLPANSRIRLTTDDFVPDADRYTALSLPALVQTAQSSRPDLMLAQLGTDQAKKTFSYEKASSIPDVTLKAGYDRGGNFMYNFIGFGAGLDIPIFNRNQGNIRSARIGIEKAALLQEDRNRRVEAEVKEAFLNLTAGMDFYKRIDPGYEAELDRLLASYISNFRSRNISMLEFLDFLRAYMDNKKTILGAKRSLNEAIEELKYAVGTEIN